jgi:hypothetical protein
LKKGRPKRCPKYRSCHRQHGVKGLTVKQIFYGDSRVRGNGNGSLSVAVNFLPRSQLLFGSYCTQVKQCSLFRRQLSFLQIKLRATVKMDVMFFS